MLSFAKTNTQNTSTNGNAVPLCLAQGHRRHPLGVMGGGSSHLFPPPTIILSTFDQNINDLVNVFLAEEEVFSNNHAGDAHYTVLLLQFGEVADVVDVCADIYDIRYFPELKEKYSVMSVPCMIVGEELYFGKKNIDEIADILGNR